MSVVISVENVSKLYRLGEIGTGSLAHDVNRWWHKVRGKEDPYLKIGQVNDREKKAENLKTEKLKEEANGEDPKVLSAFQRFSVSASSSMDYVYALKDVSFEAKQGEVLGIIGRNGAGKSTLLKILSRVTTPTTGIIKAKGRIASLLEVGTGFHPELSGRDNIYLNGAILGMRKNEIARKFDEIVDFSGCERYIDTPVKRYSSGMYVRLAFAVAAHLEPEILIIDEVLAVGDAEFQKKCLGKMKDVAGEGRTVLFVSHTMSAISSLCSRCLLMENGRIASNGTPSEIIPFYFRMGKESPSSVDFTKGQTISGEGATLLSAQITDDQGMPLAEALITKPIQIRMRYRVDIEQKSPHYPNFHVFDGTGNYVFVAVAEAAGLPTKTGEYEAICHIPARFLNDGTYCVGIALTIAGTVRVAFFEREALHLHLKDPLEETMDTLRNGYAGPVPGVVRPSFEWNIIKIS